MNAKALKQLKLEVWKANAEKQRVLAELKAAGIAREMLAKQLTALSNVAHAAIVFVAAQAPLAQGDFAGDKFQELERAVEAVTKNFGQPFSGAGAPTGAEGGAG